MTAPFKGTINVDIRDSVPDWGPYEQPRAPEGAPNVLMVVIDDLGFAGLGCYGGVIDTPNIDRIASNGVAFTNWHTTALCSPTRSCLLTGRNHTTNGMACIGEATTGFPGSNGHIPFECATLGEVLGELGWNTYMLGKWHLCPEDEVNMASTKRNWPLGRGFERYYGFLGGESSQYFPDLVYDNHPVQAPATPEEGYHFTGDITDRAIEFIRDGKSIAPHKPFFMYFCPGAAHAPHQAPPEWIERYRGRFSDGYEAIRHDILARQLEDGVVPPGTELPAINPIGTPETRTGPGGEPFPYLDWTRPWDELSAEERSLFERMAEVFAGFVSHTDHHIGRLVDAIDQLGELDNTIVMVVADNGTSGEGGPNGSFNENLFFNGIADSVETNLKHLDELGGPRTYGHMPNGWSMAFNTPFKMWKRYAYEGGSADPCVISWPAGFEGRGRRDQYHHATDIVPTIYECLGVELPETVQGYTQKPIEGVSMRYTFDHGDAPTTKETQFYTMLGNRAIWHKGWKAVTDHPTISGWGNFVGDTWELYDTTTDRSEIRNLAAEHPDRLEELIQLWFHEAGRYQGLPIDDRGAVDVLGSPRPQLAPARDRYVYFPGSAEVPEAAAVNTRNRSYDILAQLTVPDGGAEGVIFSHGSLFGGHSLYVAGGRLRYCYNFVGIEQQIVVADTDFPTGGTHRVEASFAKTHEDPPGTAHGVVSLFVDEHKVGEGTIRTQPGKFSLAGEGLNVGLDEGSPVTDDYHGERPWRFTGDIAQVTVDVSGEPYVDLDKEAVAMMKRD